MIEHSAYLAGSPDSVFEAIEALAEKNGFDVERTEASLRIDAPLGQVTMRRSAPGAEITFGAESPALLQLLKDVYAQRFAKLGLEQALEWQPLSEKWPLNQIFCRVVSTTRISPNFMRLRLEGDFRAFARPGAGLHFRLLFSETGADWPRLDERGLTLWPGGVQSWHRPPYTVRVLSPDADWMDVDIVLHDGGRVTDWCSRVQPGEEVVMHGPSGSSQLNAGWLGLIGDETALPVLMRLIEGAPAATSGQATILVRDPGDMQELRSASAIRLNWADMNATDPTELISELKPPEDDYRIFFAAERSQATEARKIFKQVGFRPGQAKAASYWTDPARDAG
ncbi:MAG: siderophore-interacting protein [Pseudomonadota bacterium]